MITTVSLPGFHGYDRVWFVSDVKTPLVTE